MTARNSIYEVFSMKLFQQMKPVTLLCAAVLGLASASVSADAGRSGYACQVVAKGGFPGFVLVQATDSKNAEEIANRNSATTLDGFPARSFELVECVKQRGERFRDTSFQDRFENLGL